MALVAAAAENTEAIVAEPTGIGFVTAFFNTEIHPFQLERGKVAATVMNGLENIFFKRDIIFKMRAGFDRFGLIAAIIAGKFDFLAGLRAEYSAAAGWPRAVIVPENRTFVKFAVRFVFFNRAEIVFECRAVCFCVG